MSQGRKLTLLAAFLIAVVGLFVFAEFRENKYTYLRIIAEISLFASASIVTHFLYHILEKEEHLRDVRSAIKETEDTILNGVVAASNRLGLDGFEEKLDYGKLFDSLEVNDELLWLDTYAQAYTTFISEFVLALERGCSIRMLVIDPECDNVKHRAAEIGGHVFADPTVFPGQVKHFISTIKSVASPAIRTSGSIEVRTYSSLPCVPLYIIQKSGSPIRGYSSFFFHRATDGYFHIKWRHAQNGFLAEAKEYFEKKWEANAENRVFKAAPSKGPIFSSFPEDK
jgi:hypothetical protein